jgi:DNA-binding SARP family transcriptional activator
MPELALYLLGPPRVERESQPLELQYRKNTALLAYLAVTGERHTREALVALLWPELDSGRARANLRRNLSLLRQALGGHVLTVEGDSIGLDAEADVWLDVNAFHRLLSSCRNHGHPEAQVCPECLVALEQAVALHRGDFLAGFSLTDSLGFDDWQFFEAEQLRRELASALERLVRGHSAHEQYDSAISYARRWLALDPLHEPAHRALMRLYAASGQRAAALRQYGECERLLQEELGAAPEPETTQLYEAIRSGTLTSETRFLEENGFLGNPPSPPMPEAGPAGLSQGNLPVSLSSFVGRAHELEELAGLVHAPSRRLVTVVGPGGMGKTRLALETARRAADHFPDGAWWVDLAPLPPDASVPRAVAGALGVQEQPGRPLPEVIAGSLHGRRLLLVLDNCEHLIEAAAELTTHLLSHCPELTVLATSREPLHVAGEQLYPVPPMGLAEQEVRTPQDLTGSSPVTKDQAGGNTEAKRILTS